MRRMESLETVLAREEEVGREKRDDHRVALKHTRNSPSQPAGGLPVKTAN